jgi:hypothetical protein
MTNNNRKVAALVAGTLLLPVFAYGANEFQSHEGDIEVHDFAFRDGEHLPLLRLHHTTLGTPRRDAQGKVTNAVVLLHATAQTEKASWHPPSPTTCSSPGSPWMLNASILCCRTVSVSVAPQSHPTSCGGAFHTTAMMTK